MLPSVLLVAGNCSDGGVADFLDPSEDSGGGGGGTEEPDDVKDSTTIPAFFRLFDTTMFESEVPEGSHSTTNFFFAASEASIGTGTAPIGL